MRFAIEIHDPPFSEVCLSLLVQIGHKSKMVRMILRFTTLDAILVAILKMLLNVLNVSSKIYFSFVFF